MESNSSESYRNLEKQAEWYWIALNDGYCRKRNPNFKGEMQTAQSQRLQMNQKSKNA